MRPFPRTLAHDRSLTLSSWRLSLVWARASSGQEVALDNGPSLAPNKTREGAGKTPGPRARRCRNLGFVVQPTCNCGSH